MKQASLFIVDDHQIVINGLMAMLGKSPEVTVLFACTNGNALMQALQQAQPDAILLDIQLPGTNGIDLCRMITRQYPAVKVIALTSQDSARFVQQMIRNGAAGYLLKTAGYDTIIKAVQTVLQGERFLDEQLQQHLLHEAITGQHTSRHEIPLTNREKEVLQLIAEEYSNQEIAGRLLISLRTVEAHRLNILHKLGAKNVAGLVKAAIKRGLV